MIKVDADTQFCFSLAARPGTFGSRFHNFLYGELKLNFVYRGSTTTDLPAAVAGLKALRIRGCGLSMPFKEQVLSLLDEIDPTARRIGAVNTIVNEDARGAGRLIGYNTDYVAMRELLKMRKVGPGARVALAGSGGMASACAQALKDLGCSAAVLSRNRLTGEALAGKHGFEWRDLARAKEGDFDVLINATPIGMAPDPADRLPFAEPLIRSARLAVESVANPARTSFVGIARDAGLSVIEGFDISVAQAAEQFRLYTGVALRPDQVARAAVYARAKV